MGRWGYISLVAVAAVTALGIYFYPNPPINLSPAQNPGLQEPTGSDDSPELPLAEENSPVCASKLTPSRTEGPYYKPSSPERTSLLEPSATGTKLFITGYVYNQHCQPITNAWLDFWQTDDNGNYDTAGYTLRGHQFTDNDGRYHLETILPASYDFRTPHIHVKVKAPIGPTLTTQIFFMGQPQNETDLIFHPMLAANLNDTAEGKTATFNFTIENQ